MTQYCVLSSQITSVGYVGNVICLKFAQESFKVLFEKELVKNMMYLVWELNPQLSVHETNTLPSELTRFYICQTGFEPTTFRTTGGTSWQDVKFKDGKMLSFCINIDSLSAMLNEFEMHSVFC